MTTYTVYRVDYRTKREEVIGKLVERRKAQLDDHAAGMLRMAKKLYARPPFDSNIFIVDEGKHGSPLVGGE